MIDRMASMSHPDQSMHAPVSATTPPLVCLVMGLSGFCGLAYQMVWTQQFGVWLGHEIVSVLAVVAAFFSGLAAGAFMLGQRIGRSPHPVRWYAACEVVIATWGALLIWLMPVANQWLAQFTGTQPSLTWQWSIAFIGPLLLLLPATFAMGATLPVIERVTGRLRSEGYAIGGLYAANTWGGVVGVLAATFLLVPWLGLSLTALVCVIANLVCAGLALLLFPAVSAVASADADAASASPAARDGGMLARLFVTGLLGIGYEVLVVRVLSQVMEDTVYTFAILLAVYLIGTAGGAAFYQRQLAASEDAPRLRQRLLCLLAAAMLAGIVGLWASESIRDMSTGIFSTGFISAIAVETAVALAAFALPSFVMGALFCHLCVEAKASGWHFGSAIGINTVGAALAPLLFGVLLLPWVGSKLLLIAIALGYLVLVPIPHWRRAAVWLPALAAVLVVGLTGPLRFVTLPEGGRLLSYREGVMASVSVVEDQEGVARLRIDNRQQEGSSATGLADARLAYLPLLLHPAPRQALFLGLGTGVTAAAAAEDPALKVDVVELLPEVISAAAYFRTANTAVTGAGTPHIMAADARRYVRAGSKGYDVIVADLFHPARSGAGALYTAEHFAAIRARLNPGGLFCQWLPLHQLDIATLRTIVNTFTSIYPNSFALLANNSLETPVLALIARPDIPYLEPAAISRRLASPLGQSRRAGLQLADNLSLLGGVIAGPSALARFGAGSARNTDDHPTVAHAAPAATYAPKELPRERLQILLAALSVQPEDLFGLPVADGLSGSEDARYRLALAAYWQARNRFLEVGMRVQPSADPRRMLAQVQQPLLEVVSMSPDFRPAYDPLLAMAVGLSQVDVAGARALLAQLVQRNPGRPEAAVALQNLR